MRWFEDEDLLPHLRYLWNLLKLWWIVPDKRTRIACRHAIRKEAHELWEDALRKEEWLAKYEKREVKSHKEISRRVIAEIRNRR